MQQDYNKQLAETERLVERLSKQAEQEVAMAAVLPVRFSENIAAFDKYLPDIAAQFKNYSPIRPSRFFCSENGIPNLLWLDTNQAQYGDDPYTECMKQIESILNSHTLTRIAFGKEENFFNQIHVDYLNQLVSINLEAEAVLEKKESVIEAVPLALMFGVGLGYQIGYLFEHCDIANFFIFEPDLDVFYASLYTFDWKPFLDFIANENKGFHIFLGQDENTIMQDVSEAIANRGAFLASTVLSFWHYPSDSIFKTIEQIISEFFLLSKGWGFFDDNLFALAHSAENITSGVHFLKRNRKINPLWRKTPVFVIGNGPSLDAALPYIREYQRDAVLVACGSSISALHRAGIKPDIYVSVERTKSMSDFLELLNEPDYLRDILFLSTDVTHPEHKQYFERIGLGFKFNEPMFSILKINFPELSGQLAPLQSTNPLVGNIGLSMPITLGFEEIYMFGLDNGYKDDAHCHSKLSAYYDENGQQIDALTRTSSGDMIVPGNFGGSVISNPLFSMAAHVMGNLLENMPKIHCFNCSDGAKIRGAIPLHLEEIVIQNKQLEKRELINHIYDDLYAPILLTKEQIKDKLDVDFFMQLIDRLIQEWDEPLINRIGMTQRMQRQYEYMRVLADTRQHHIHRVLVGTLNYVFAMVSVLAYRFEDEVKTMEFVAKGVKIIQAYLEKTKELYPHALECQDTSNYELLKHFRKN